MDAGATLCKLVRGAGADEAVVVPANDLQAARKQIQDWDARSVAATGGGAQRLAALLPELRIERVPEFEAWGRGVPLLARREGLELPDGYLVVSLGTGTSVLWVRGGRCERIGGSALGGGSLLGLGQLLLGVDSFERIAELARNGDRRRVDLLVGDIYGDDETPLPRELNAASFGKIDSRDPADLEAVRRHPDSTRREARLLVDSTRSVSAREGDVIVGVAVYRIEPGAVELRLGDTIRLIRVGQ